MKNLGVQLFTIGSYLSDEKQIHESFARLREMGYTEAQTANSGGVTYEELGRIAREEGIKIVGTHYWLPHMLEDFDQTIRDHEALGTTNCGIPAYSVNGVEEAEDFINVANELADRLYKHGIKLTYHNHAHEFVKFDNNKTFFDMLVEGLNPETTSFVLDTCWVQYGGGDVRYWIEKLKGRIDILHLKDISVRKSGEPPFVLEEIGNGNLYWDGIIDATKKSGVKHYCVEQDGDWIDNDPFKSLKISRDYLEKYID